MKTSERNVSTEENLHQIELKDLRCDFGANDDKVRAWIDNQQLESFSQVMEGGSKYLKEECCCENDESDVKDHTVIDILYENQRGISFCGKSMYSSNLLFFFDPSPWTDKNFNYSPFNTSTATCPDPSWKWTWDKWIIDMYGNVDDDGWSYSFSFQSKKWYGTSIWFHSFVRRRKWVRERQLKSLNDSENGNNGNYFTVNSSYKPSRPPSNTSIGSTTSISNNFELETNVEDLLKRLKGSRIDRERIRILKNFILYNSNKINLSQNQIKNILECFIFQESRRQLLTSLIKEAKNIQTEKQAVSDHSEETDKKKETNSLMEIIKLIKKEVYKYDFWEDEQEIKKIETILHT